MLTPEQKEQVNKKVQEIEKRAEERELAMLERLAQEHKARSQASETQYLWRGVVSSLAVIYALLRRLAGQRTSSPVKGSSFHTLSRIMSSNHSFTDSPHSLAAPSICA